MKYKYILDTYPEEEFLWRTFNSLDRDFKLKEGDVILDCGAHKGETTFYFSEIVGSSGKVYAIEPNKECLDILDKLNKEKFKKDNIVLINKAIHSSNKKIKFYKTEKTSIRTTLPYSKRAKEEYEEIDAYTLDNIIKDEKIEKIDKIFMNIEGAEIYALDGMKDIIKKFKPEIFIIMHIWCIKDDDERDKFIDDVILKLKSFDYKHRENFKLGNRYIFAKKRTKI